MVKKCIVVDNGKILTHLIASYIKELGLGSLTIVEGDIKKIISEVNDNCIVFFSADSFCTNIEDFCQHIYKKNKTTKIVCFYDESSVLFGLRLYRSGVNCIINSFTETLELARILKNVFEGIRYYPKEIVDAIERREYLFIDDFCKKLSPRELEIMQLIVQGHNNKYISLTLRINKTTVSSTVNRVIKKLGAENKEQAIQKLMNEGILVNCA